ncbi:hypothetical protein, partial [Burkholderia sp. SIMBA_062]|uniref:hypothetical protein n=1 Tax=Burkholderia sp. SIMBA_062 TaxID=3085803 RepID=UPI00397874FD
SHNQSIPSGTAFLLGLAFTLIREEPKKSDTSKDVSLFVWASADKGKGIAAIGAAGFSALRSPAAEHLACYSGARPQGLQSRIRNPRTSTTTRCR